MRMKIYGCKDHFGKECEDGCSVLERIKSELLEAFRDGGLLVYPTETLYGLGANPFDEDVVGKVFEVKKRPKSMAVSVAVPDVEALNEIAELNPTAEKICELFLPGPLTILLRKKKKVPDALSGGSVLVGIRIPDHPLALGLLDMLGPMTCTSANLHGQEEPGTFTIAKEQLKNEITYYFDCGPCRYQKPSTIIDLSGDSLKIIREGVIPESLIKGKISSEL